MNHADWMVVDAIASVVLDRYRRWLNLQPQHGAWLVVTPERTTDAGDFSFIHACRAELHKFDADPSGYVVAIAPRYNGGDEYLMTATRGGGFAYSAEHVMQRIIVQMFAGGEG